MGTGDIFYYDIQNKYFKLLKCVIKKLTLGGVNIICRILDIDGNEIEEDRCTQCYDTNIINVKFGLFDGL